MVGCCNRQVQTTFFSEDVDVQEFQTALDSSVLIGLREPDMSRGGSGSGVAFERTPEGKTRILTAGHVCDFAIRDSLEPWVVSAEHGLAQGEIVVIWGVDHRDLCIIETILEIPIAELGVLNPEFGIPIWNVSAPDGRYPVPFKGYIAGADSADAAWRVSISMYAQGGMSGSALWQDGKFVGIVAERAIVAPHIPISNVIQIIPSWRVLEFLNLFKKLESQWEQSDEEATSPSP